MLRLAAPNAVRKCHMRRFQREKPVAEQGRAVPKSAVAGARSGVPKAAAFSTGSEGSSPNFPCGTALGPAALPTPNSRRFLVNLRGSRGSTQPFTNVDAPAPPQKKRIGSAQFTLQKRGKIGEIQPRQGLESEGQGVPAKILPTPAYFKMTLRLPQSIRGQSQ